MKRALKQVLYGVLYLSVIFGIVFLFYKIGLEPPASCTDGRLNRDEVEVDCGGTYCTACEVRTLEDIVVIPTVLENPLDSDVTMLLLELRNPNTTYGTNLVEYSVSFYDAADALLGVYEGQSPMYPGEVTYRTELRVPIDFTRVAFTEARSSVSNWVSITEMSAPRVQLSDVQTRIEDERNRVVVSGVMKNDNSFDIRTATVHLILPGADGPLSLSKTIIQDLTPLEDRSFEVYVPVPGGVTEGDLRRPRIYVEVER